MGTFSEEQPTWYINSAASNNRSTGLDAGHALRDIEEIGRRLGKGTTGIRQATTITIAANAPTSDVFNLKLATLPGGSVRVQGVPTVDDSGTFTGVTAINRGTQQMQQVADSSQDFSAHENKILYIPSGARAGAVAGIAKHISLTGARTARWIVPSRSAGFTSTTTAPQVGDPYQVLSFPTMYMGTPTIEPWSSTQTEYVNFHNLNLSCGNSLIAGLTDVFMFTTLTACTFDFFDFDADIAMLIGCRIGTAASSTRYSKGSYTICWSSLFSHSFYLGENATLELDKDTIFQSFAHAPNISNQSRLDIGTACIFDNTASGTLFNHGTVRTFPINDGADLLWGANNNGIVKIDAGASLLYTTKPTLARSSGKQVRVGGDDIDWADAPYSNSANGARVVALIT